MLCNSSDNMMWSISKWEPNRHGFAQKYDLLCAVSKVKMNSNWFSVFVPCHFSFSLPFGVCVCVCMSVRQKKARKWSKRSNNSGNWWRRRKSTPHSLRCSDKFNRLDSWMAFILRTTSLTWFLCSFFLLLFILLSSISLSWMKLFSQSNFFLFKKTIPFFC